MDKPTPRAYRFGTFRVDLLRRELTGPDGANLNLSARAYYVLVFLLENRARVVGKDEPRRPSSMASMPKAPSRFPTD